MSKLIGTSTTGKEISIIKDPFKNDYVSEVIIMYVTTWGEPYWYAKISFKNGNTSGQQKTPEVDTFEEVIIHMKQIIESVTTKK